MQSSLGLFAEPGEGSDPYLLDQIAVLHRSPGVGTVA